LYEEKEASDLVLACVLTAAEALRRAAS
jgi:hypothetical protein